MGEFEKIVSGIEIFDPRTALSACDINHASQILNESSVELQRYLGEWLLWNGKPFPDTAVNLVTSITSLCQTLISVLVDAEFEDDED